MSIIVSNRVWSAAEYLCDIASNNDIKIDLKGNEALTFDEFDEYREAWLTELCLWDFPLTEIEYIIEAGHSVVLVSFETSVPGKFEHRFCEVQR